MNDQIETHKYSFRMKSNTKTLVRINLTHVTRFVFYTFPISYMVNYKKFDHNKPQIVAKL